jgi:hypothetical protein
LNYHGTVELPVLPAIVMFYKIMNDLAPNYLRDLIPEYVNERHQHNTRNADNHITAFICRTASLDRSFIPSTIKGWNSLNKSIRSSPTINSLKNALSKLPEFFIEKPPTYQHIGPRPENITLARLRNNCSALAAHLQRNHVTDNPIYML